MPSNILRINTIHELHADLGLPKPKHPLISLLDVAQLHIPEARIGTRYSTGMYTISLKDGSCGMEYGRHAFDFAEGVMVFTAPDQVSTITEAVAKGSIQGWMLHVHPDLLRGFPLAKSITQYGFFNYNVYEALHLSETEEEQVNTCVRNIESEYQQRIDGHSQQVMVANLDLLLSYSQRFYERQFHTRAAQYHDVVAEFETNLKRYFEEERYREEGIPSIQRFAEQAHLSQHYFSDLLKKETGRSAKDHINGYLIERAKDMLVASEHSVSEVAYLLGFNYPHYFTRLFKAKTGMTPGAFRSAN